jgi:hypothetical protein
MQERDLASWEQFEVELRLLREERSNRKASSVLHVSDFLYRGHSEHTWRLSTTLERQGKGNLTLRQYYRLISAARPQIETLTETTWNVPEYPEYEKWLSENDTLIPGRFPGYDYMVYLRHHGFPSPLLDWTRSPYVAAYFAFAHAINLDRKVSIYVYLEYAGNAKATRPELRTSMASALTFALTDDISFSKASIRSASHMTRSGDTCHTKRR